MVINRVNKNQDNNNSNSAHKRFRLIKLNVEEIAVEIKHNKTKEVGLSKPLRFSKHLFLTKRRYLIEIAYV